MTSRDWRRALNDPRIEVTSFTWSEDIGGPEEIGFLFTPNAWNAATPFRLYRKHSRFRLSVLLDGVVFEVHAYGLSNAELADEVVPLVIKDLTDDLGVRISVDHGGVPASGYFHWAPRPTWWRSAARAIARVLRGLVEDWRAIQRFAAGDAPPTPIRRRRRRPPTSPRRSWTSSSEPPPPTGEVFVAQAPPQLSPPNAYAGTGRRDLLGREDDDEVPPPWAPKPRPSGN